LHAWFTGGQVSASFSGVYAPCIEIAHGGIFNGDTGCQLAFY